MTSATPEADGVQYDIRDDAQDAPLVSEPAPAKVNLYLHVTELYPSGYHGLDSLVTFTRLGDTLDLRRGPGDSGIRLTAGGPFAGDLGAAEDNLAMRAARALADAAAPTDTDVSLTLTKRLPVASGVGGGSADAAAAIRALGRYWGLGGRPDLLFEVALGLGADVPMCLGCRARPTIQIAGIGDEIAPAAALPPFHLLLVNPGVAVATPAVFAARAGAFSQPMPLDHAPADAADFARALRLRSNDLTGAAVSIAPAIGDALEALAGTDDCLLARMSGSGATCFGLYAEPGQAETAAGRLRQAYPDWWVRATAALATRR